MHKDTKGIDPYATGNIYLAGTKDVTRPNDDVGDPKSFGVLDDDFVLFNFSEAIGIAAQLWTRFDWAGLVQQSPVTLLRVGVDGK